MAITGVHQKTLALMLAAGLALGACAKKEELLSGERFGIRPVDGQEQAAQAATPTVTKVSVPAAQNHSQWTHKNGDAAHNISHPALRSSLTRVWSQNMGAGNSKKDRLTADPVVAGGRVYTLDAKSSLRAFSTGGAPLWSTGLEPAWEKNGDAYGGGLAFGNGVLIATTGYGEVIAVDPATGGIKWRHRTHASITAAPLVIDGVAIAVTLDNRAFALDLANGRIRWQVQSGGSSTGLSGAGAPAAVGNFAAIPFASGEMVGVNIKTGARVWSAAVSGGGKGLARSFVGSISGDPVIAGNTVYAANQSGRLVSINRETGKRNWTVNDGAYGPVWVTGRSIFLVTDAFKLKRLEASTGAEVWSVTLPGYLKEGKKQREAHVQYGPILAGNRLIVAGSDGEIRSFDPSTGAPLGAVKIAGGAASQPAIVNGVMYILSG
ncbi:MAG: PQQ-like beta-propeller repeat protein, partial [Proteobacteria bacterium]|nr:PQQ-like beta-propeller repeat protein [Pseudomonadota bacterium]